MEPTSFNVGDTEQMLVLSRKENASMEPTSFNVGDKNIPDAAAYEQLRASMEPTSFNVGDTMPAPSCNSFVKLLQWSRRLSTSETAVGGRNTRGPGGFNGADVFQRRRPPLRSAGHSRRQLRFNGADVFQRRRRLRD